MSEIDRIKLSKERPLTDEEKQQLASRFGSGKRGRKHGCKLPATIIREMMENEFASVNEKNMKAIAEELGRMALEGEGKEKLFAMKLLFDVNARIIDRSIEENKGDSGELIVNVNRGSVSIQRGNDVIKIESNGLDETINSVEILSKTKDWEAPEELSESLGYEEED